MQHQPEENNRLATKEVCDLQQRRSTYEEADEVERPVKTDGEWRDAIEIELDGPVEKSARLWREVWRKGYRRITLSVNIEVSVLAFVGIFRSIWRPTRE